MKDKERKILDIQRLHETKIQKLKNEFQTFSQSSAAAERSKLGEIEDLKQVMGEEKRKHKDAIDALKSEHESIMRDKEKRYLLQLKNMNEKHAQEISNLQIMLNESKK